MTLLDDLAAIEKRIAEASPGPWPNHGHDTLLIEQPSGNGILTGYEHSIEESDCEFIAHARTDLPALVEMVRLLSDLNTHEYLGAADHEQQLERLWAEANTRAQDNAPEIRLEREQSLDARAAKPIGKAGA